ncbi:efflux RND transporter periplasmic adaptor subunit [Mesobacillus boroniphilus]|uniref:Efflux RND transporter periplasmic adaptor subunit n=1 Tax=Mesobacillus boroniphilus TaxID=308892 RepID=A0A944CM22_9BACI|nr:efflux RND transporter periplasmic adaptor subunit [Mesobacillus boroniphilus]MBS8265618.1 efflux RND transporter periplasmic adaptor subunit [Mesobacillus boroniphilus]
MKKKTAILASAGIIFVSANLFLALKDDSKAVRSSYINKWTAVGKDNLTETLHAAGVVIPEDEHQVYYNDDDGEFKGFLVKEGDKVDNGTPLYEYSSNNIDEDLAKLEAEKSQLVTESNLIDDQIKQLTYLQSVSASTSSTSTPVFGDGSSSRNDSNDLMNVSIEKEIYDKQREKGRVEAEIEKYEDLIDSYEGSDELGKNSEVSGTVKQVNYELKNPIVTIISDKPKVEGTFSERDLKKVEEGMKVYVQSDLLKGKVAGTLTKIADYPETDPSVKKESYYPFEITLNEETEEKIIKGSHVEVSVITDQVKNAATIPEKAIEKGKKNSYIYVLNETGEVEKRKISKGLQLGGKTELKKGAKPGELVVQKPENVQEENNPFFSKLNIDSLKKKTFRDESKRTIFKHIMVGFFK